MQQNNMRFNKTSSSSTYTHQDEKYIDHVVFAFILYYYLLHYISYRIQSM